MGGPFVSSEYMSVQKMRFKTKIEIKFIQETVLASNILDQYAQIDI